MITFWVSKRRCLCTWKQIGVRFLNTGYCAMYYTLILDNSKKPVYKHDLYSAIDEWITAHNHESTHDDCIFWTKFRRQRSGPHIIPEVLSRRAWRGGWDCCLPLSWCWQQVCSRGWPETRRGSQVREPDRIARKGVKERSNNKSVSHVRKEMSREVQMETDNVCQIRRADCQRGKDWDEESDLEKRIWSRQIDIIKNRSGVKDRERSNTRKSDREKQPK